MKKLGPFIFLICILSSCNHSFHNSRRHSHRNYVSTGELKDNGENATIEQLELNFQTIKIKVFPRIKNVQKANCQPSIKENKWPNIEAPAIKNHFESSAKHPLETRAERVGKPTLNMLGFIFSVTMIIWLVGFILGIIGVALNRPLRGLGIAAICIGAALIITAFVLLCVFVL